MAKMDIDTNDDALITNVARYQYLALLTDKTPSQKSELITLEALLIDYKLSASDYNGAITQQNENTDKIANMPKIETGVGTFNTTTGVYISHSVGSDNYTVSITPNSLSGYIGEIYVTKTDLDFTVFCTGSDTTTTFSYVLIKG